MNCKRFIRPLALSLTLLVLAGCADNFGAPGPVKGEFARTLGDEYVELADYELKVLGDAQTSNYFQSKAGKAREGLMPLPDDPAQFKVPEDSQQQIGNAYTQLIQALQKGAWIDNGAMAAMAQTRFDCWLSMQANVQASGTLGLGNPPVPAEAPPPEITPGAGGGPVAVIEASPFPVKADAGAGCRDKFWEAMAILKTPAPQPGHYSLLFPAHSIGIDPSGEKILATVARPLQDQPGWIIALTGHADPAETLPDDRNIGVRRATSTRNVLQEYGVERGAILIATGDPVPGEQQTARVDIDVLPKTQAGAVSSLRPEDVMPEHFNTTPVF